MGGPHSKLRPAATLIGILGHAIKEVYSILFQSLFRPPCVYDPSSPISVTRGPCAVLWLNTWSPANLLRTGSMTSRRFRAHVFLALTSHSWTPRYWFGNITTPSAWWRVLEHTANFPSSTTRGAGEQTNAIQLRCPTTRSLMDPVDLTGIAKLCHFGGPSQSLLRRGHCGSG